MIFRKDTSMKYGTVYFKNLDGIRFIAAFIVLLSHIIRPALNLVEITPWLKHLLATLMYGGTGVTIFFVLSGFLITYKLLEEKELTGQIQIKKFYVRRTLRIWPLYFLVLLFSFFLYPFLKSMLGLNQTLCTNVWYHLSFLANFDVLRVREYCVGQDAMSQNINWSIAIEEQFYIFWPLLFIFLNNRRQLIALVILFIAAGLFRLYHQHAPSILYFHTLAVLPDLAMGGLFAYAIHRWKKIRIFFETRGSRSHLLFMTLLLSVLLLGNEFSLNSVAAALLRFIIAFLTALVIVSQAMTKKRSPLEAGNLRFASYWGKYSYGIYLLHPIAMLFVDILQRSLHLQIEHFITALLSGVFNIALTLLMSWVIYHSYEKFFLRLKTRFSPDSLPDVLARQSAN